MAMKPPVHRGAQGKWRVPVHREAGGAQGSTGKHRANYTKRRLLYSLGIITLCTVQLCFICIIIRDGVHGLFPLMIVNSI